MDIIKTFYYLLLINIIKVYYTINWKVPFDDERRIVRNPSTLNAISKRPKKEGDISHQQTSLVITENLTRHQRHFPSMYYINFAANGKEWWK